MGRAEIRQRERENEKRITALINSKEDLFVLTRKEYEALILKLKVESSRKVLDTVIAAVIIALHDSFGFGKSRLDKVVELTTSHLESVNMGYVTIDEIKTECVKTGFDSSKVFDSIPEFKR